MNCRRPAVLALAAVFVLLLAGCVFPGARQTPTTSPTGRDFTVPGAAAAMVQQLLARAGHRQALMVEVTTGTVQVSVLTTDHKPVTWAYREGEIEQVPSDLAYVDQATFDVSEFNLSDVGGLFRAAASMSGSEENQSLTIVDYSAGEVMMSVSTVPESRTVFFNPDGSLLEQLNFDAPGGIARGIEAITGYRTMVYSLTVDSVQGAWVEYPGEDEKVIRRTRTAKVPVTTNVRAETVDLPLISAARVDPEVIWRVLDSVRGTPDVPEDAPWNVVADDRDRVGLPRLHFTIGPKTLVTDLAGNLVVSG